MALQRNLAQAQATKKLLLANDSIVTDPSDLLKTKCTKSDSVPRASRTAEMYSDIP